MLCFRLRISWCFTLCCLAVMLLTLQVFHVILLNQLEVKNSEMKKQEMSQFMEHQYHKVYPVIKQSVFSSHIMDRSGEFVIIPDILHTRSLMTEEEALRAKKFGVTLVTQCSVNHLHHLMELSQRWQGPISIAVFVPQHHTTVIIETILLLHYCMPYMSHNISVHLVTPLSDNHPNLFKEPVITNHAVQCHNMQDIIENIFKKQLQEASNYELLNVKFPNNLLRNVARRYSQTDYIMVIDIDMLPSSNLYTNFIDFARRTTFTSDTSSVETHTVYVIPAFEIHTDLNVPLDKKSLLEVWKTGDLRPFYFEPCLKCQWYTDYSLWRNLTLSKSLSAAYEREWKYPWEPLHIGRVDELPEYDERFRQYGFNRLSQACELHIAGFKFKILDHAFLVHVGFKTQDSFHHQKDIEQEINRAHYKRFREEIKAKYQESDRSCTSSA